MPKVGGRPTWPILLNASHPGVLWARLCAFAGQWGRRQQHQPWAPGKEAAAQATHELPGQAPATCTDIHTCIHAHTHYMHTCAHPHKHVRPKHTRRGRHTRAPLSARLGAAARLRGAGASRAPESRLGLPPLWEGPRLAFPPSSSGSSDDKISMGLCGTALHAWWWLCCAHVSACVHVRRAVCWRCPARPPRRTRRAGRKWACAMS